jgi:hypothetical protein
MRSASLGEALLFWGIWVLIDLILRENEWQACVSACSVVWLMILSDQP